MRSAYRCLRPGDPKSIRCNIGARDLSLALHYARFCPISSTFKVQSSRAEAQGGKTPFERLFLAPLLSSRRQRAFPNAPTLTCLTFQDFCIQALRFQTMPCVRLRKRTRERRGAESTEVRGEDADSSLQRKAPSELRLRGHRINLIRGCAKRTILTSRFPLCFSSSVPPKHGQAQLPDLQVNLGDQC